MSKTNDRWSALSMKDRAELINIYVKSGITDLGEIRRDYNNFGSGGDLNEENDVNNTEHLDSASVTDYSKAIEEGKSAVKFVKDYYKSEAYKQRAKRANFPKRYPLKKSFGLFNFRPRFDENLNTSQSYKWLFPVIGLQQSDDSNHSNYYDEIGNISAHEYAHLNKFFNKKGGSLSPDSLYYGNDYTKVRRFSDALEVNKAANIHDLELSESYSDLMGLRYLMNKYDIFDSLDKNAVFTEDDYDDLINNENFKGNRFLNLHTKEQTIKAINDVAKNIKDSEDFDYVNPINVAKLGGRLLDGTAEEQTLNGLPIGISILTPYEDSIIIPYRSVVTPEMNTEFIRNSDNKFDTFVERMYPIVEQSLVKKGYSQSNINNILKQMAQESNYGLSPRGNGYNLSGIKAWNDNEGTKHSDGEFYRDFKDYSDYVDYYVELLNNRYDALNAKDLDDYIYRLHHTKSGRKYSADEEGYKKNLKNMVSLDRAINKYLNK